MGARTEGIDEDFGLLELLEKREKSINERLPWSLID
jgi:hypothetical protein